MDEKKPRRRWLSFGIRDLLWAMVVVGMAVVIWREHRLNAKSQARVVDLELQVAAAKNVIQVFATRRKSKSAIFPESQDLKDLPLSDPGADSQPIESFQNFLMPEEFRQK